ncbi:MAG: hypothetical protein M1813_007900 [Trichoglossum hirsutum]|nr:MAG: hypothetical protein M1813_007900 [Trichoglossum hirsutum]
MNGLNGGHGARDIEEQQRRGSGTSSQNDDVIHAWDGPGFRDGELSVTAQKYPIREEHKLGYWSTAGVIANRMIGTGIFSVPSTVMRATDSTGASLLMWAVGGILAFCGLSTFLEFGMAIPRSGGEKVYIERIYRHPRYLATCVYAIEFVLLANTAGNAVAFSQYLQRAFQPSREYGLHNKFPEGRTKGISIGAISFTCLILAVWPRFSGRYLMSGLAALKSGLLVLVICTGIAALAGVGKGNPQRENFRPGTAFRHGRIENFAGSYAVALLQITYSYRGWENANYVLGEVRNPRRTLKRSAPLAVGTVSVLYILAIISYNAALTNDEMQRAGITFAADFFLKVCLSLLPELVEMSMKIVVPLCIAISAFGNVLAVTFANSRVKQELGKEGVLPFSTFWASTLPKFNTPGPALALHWAVSVLVISIPNSDDAYNFVVLLFTYGQSIVGLAVGAGLLYLRYGSSSKHIWRLEASHYTSPMILTLIFALSNLFLIIAPYMPNGSRGANFLTGKIPFWVFPTVVWGVFALGVVYWVGFAKVAPMVGWAVEVQREVDQDGVEVVKYRHLRPHRERPVSTSNGQPPLRRKHPREDGMRNSEGATYPGT